jgi:hypothetical protein
VVDPSGHVSNPDGLPVRGDGGHSFGAFQFYELAGTWGVYGEGGDPDNLGDAAAATAKMLCANNYAQDRHAAIARHNGSGPAAQAYADRVVAAADAAPPITAAPSSGSSGDDGCEETGRRSIGDVLNRAWCSLVVRPWQALGRKNPSPEWDKADQFVFGVGSSSGSTGSPAGPVGAPTGNLVDLPADLCDRAGGCQLDSSWAPGLIAALRAAAADGHPIVVHSANRSSSEQVAIYARNCPTPDCPGGLTAVPGTSNHEGGQAADLAHRGGGGLAGPGDPAWEWLKANGPRYGVLQDPSITSRDSVHFSATGN